MIDWVGTLRRLVIAIAANYLRLAVVQATTADTNADLEVVDGIVDDILVDTQLLIGRLTAARAGYLEYINNANLETIADISTLTATNIAYLDELAAANLPSDIDNLLVDTAAVAHHEDARSRVYPQDTQSRIQLTCTATADTWGSWTQVIPIDLVGFEYKLIGIQVEEASEATTYCIQLGFSTVGGSDPTTAQILGERRIKMLGTPIKSIHDEMDYFSYAVPANAKLWGRVKSSSGAADTIDISVVLLRHVPVTTPIEPLTTWPWAV